MAPKSGHATSGNHILRTLFDAVCTEDVALITKLLHDDLVVTEPRSLPFGGVYRGRDAFLGRLLPAIVGPFKMAVEDVRVVNGGGQAAAVLTVRFTSRRTGKSLAMPYVEIYDFEGGLISQIGVYPQDTAELGDFLRAEA
jgi:ketosteroid isomerase-like protein